MLTRSKHDRRLDHGLIAARVENGVVGHGVIEARNRIAREHEIAGQRCRAETGIHRYRPACLFIHRPLRPVDRRSPRLPLREVQQRPGMIQFFAGLLQPPAAVPVESFVSPFGVAAETSVRP